jgi:N-methylhydantoinase A/oxoprolinase/acetone carboxylase beta subunit
MTEATTARRLLLGIDTGGTFTDAVIFDELSSSVIRKAKAPTTHHDLGIGIRSAIDAALADIDPRQIELVSLSTTLATNAIVEGTGRRVAAVIIGFDDDVVDRGGLAEALGTDPVVFVDGGHDTHGQERAPLDLELLSHRILDIDTAANGRTVDGFAVMAQFSVRNPAHELRVAALIRQLTGKPVTCSHELSAQLNAPARAVTAILNARLVPIIDRLVTTTRQTMVERGLDAPLMVVRGDGSLVSAAFVLQRPIETILSGPAASVVGAAHLSGLADAIISDVGGTTTDIAVLRHGAPLISALGATVGGHRTMVAAVAMHTHGLGGDSQVAHDERAKGPTIRIGPRRVIPVGLAAIDHPAMMHAALDRQLAAEPPSDLDGVFVLLPDEQSRSTLVGTERAIAESITRGIATAATVMSSLAQRRVVERLVARGVLQLAAFTPSDANHVLGRQATFDVNASFKAAQLFARRRDRLGQAIAPDAVTLSELVFANMVRRSAEAVLAAAFDHDGLPAGTVESRPVQAALDGQHGSARIAVSLSAPLVALGASAATFYPTVASLVGAESFVHPDADVANAIGAVVGRVRITRTATVTAPEPGIYLVHGGSAGSGVRTTSVAAARESADATLRATLQSEMIAAGAAEFEVVATWDESAVEVGGTDVFVQATLTMSAAGRPQLAV